MQPHRRQPTRLPCPWDSPGKNTGVGCHFLLQCMKVKSESEVTQSYPTLRDPMDCSLPGSSVHGIFQARVREWGAIAFSGVIVYTHDFNYSFPNLALPNFIHLFWLLFFSNFFLALQWFILAAFKTFARCCHVFITVRAWITSFSFFLCHGPCLTPYSNHNKWIFLSIWSFSL